MPPKIQWKQDDMIAAIRAVRAGLMSTSTAATVYDVPEGVLRIYVKKARLVPVTPQKSSAAPAADGPSTSGGTSSQVAPPIPGPAPLDAESAYDRNRRKTRRLRQSWYCHACKYDMVADMRQCTKCKKWYHEVCVGLTAEDLSFECPFGC
ncbi:uncharacterized protein LOC142982907 [Anticarsia gemmatalis]|uniref:uncharacterized protein LOC142982907 n=1 Tax=Anticarsia gemmatalis TaxID=129554 RepID=UPI003F776430